MWLRMCQAMSRCLQMSYQHNYSSQVLLIARLNAKGGVKMVMYPSEKTKQVARTLTKLVSDLPSNDQGEPVEAEQQHTTFALCVTNSVPIIPDLVLSSMQISAM